MKVRAAPKSVAFPYLKRDRRRRESRLLEMEYSVVVRQLGHEPTSAERVVVEELTRLRLMAAADTVMNAYQRQCVANTIGRLQSRLGIEIGPAPEADGRRARQRARNLAAVAGLR